MSTAQVLVQEQLAQILENSIDRRDRLVLTHNSPQGWRTFSSQFLGRGPSSDDRLDSRSHQQVILVKTPVPREGCSSQLPEPGDTVGVTFRFGHKKCMFSAILESIQGDGYSGMTALRWPDQLQQLKRRAYERARPPKDVIIAVRFWREGFAGGQAASGTDASSGRTMEGRTVYHGQLEDLSAGGMRVRVANPDHIQLGVAYRFVLAPRPGKPALILDALARHREAAEHGRASAGFQFVGMETTPQGRQTLDRLVRLVHQFQRARSQSRR